MKLNPDCIREILLAVESKTGYMNPVNTYDVVEAVHFSFGETMYHINQCELYGFFTEVRHYANGDDNCTIMDLSPKGHEFIGNITDDNVWNKTKNVAKAAGSLSISFLIDVAKSVLSAKLGLQ